MRRRARTLAAATRPAAPVRCGSEPAGDPPAGGARDRRLEQPAPQRGIYAHAHVHVCVLRADGTRHADGAR
eukprot:6680865-Prymnesium_polylepis.1